MNEDLDVFEQQLKKSFVDVPLPTSLEPGRVAEALKREPAIKVVKTPAWKRVAAIAACAVLAVGVATASVTVIKGNLVGTGTAESKVNTESFDTQSSYGVGATSSGADASDDGQLKLEASSDSAEDLVYGDVELPQEVSSAVDDAICSASYAADAVDAEQNDTPYTAIAFTVTGYCQTDGNFTVYADVMSREYISDADVTADVRAERFYPVRLSVDMADDGAQITSFDAYPDDDYEYGAAELLPPQLADADAEINKTMLASQCDTKATQYYSGGGDEG